MINMVRPLGHRVSCAGQLLVTVTVLLSGLLAAPTLAAQSLPDTEPIYTKQDQQKLLYQVLATTLSTIPKPANCAMDACVALTFDDGPDAAMTPKILDTLAETGVHATFFVVGNKIAGHEALLRREIADGHVVGNHTWDHKDLTKLTAGDIQAEIDQTSQAMVTAGLPTPTLMRPPYGSVNIRVANATQLPVILWNVDPRDWHNEEPDADITSIMSAAQPGAIILMHDTHAATAAALPTVIAELKQRGYKLVTVSELLQLPAGSRGVYRGR